MPDDSDYEWLGWLVSHPHDWTDDDAATVLSMIADQRAELDDLHPKDARGRRSYLELIDELEKAHAAYLGSRA